MIRQDENRMEYLALLDEKTFPVIRLILEEMPGGFFIYYADGDGELVYINNAMLRIFGCDTEEEFKKLTGYTFKGMVYHEDYERVQTSIEKQIADSVYALDYVEYRIIQRDGSVRWIQDYGHFIHTRAYGDIFCVFIEDATERMKRRMEELEQINQELSNLFARENYYKKAILYDAELFFEVNLTKDSFISSVTQMIDGKACDPAAFMNREPFTKYSEYVAFYEQNADFEKTGEFSSFFSAERLIRCCEKGELEQAFNSWILDGRGRRRLRHYVFLLAKNEHTGDVEALFIAKDITDQEEKQRLLQTALLQAESANQARNIFLSNISHDIRTPLNAIIGYVELIQNHITERERVSRYSEKIRLFGEQLLSIVNEFLEITRMESGKMNLNEKQCDLLDLFAEVERIILPMASKKSLHFEIQTSGLCHHAVVVDYIRLKEILLQLLDNAVKYTNSGGHVSLTATETDIDFSGYGKYEFVVADDGIGISSEFMSSLFEPFKRENNTTHSGVLGTGLGLAVVKNLVDMMEGEIRIESERGKGSRFIFSLLLRLHEDSGSVQQPERLPINMDSLVGRRILLVEDNEINMEIADELLRTEGYLVETAENGAKAVDIISRSEPGYYDLILMDIQMPVMDGYEATKRIRGLENERLAQIPIIALSANAFAEDYHRSLEAGMDGHAPKPIDMSGLQELIRTVLGGCRQMP